jgi:hypothetical protein
MSQFTRVPSLTVVLMTAVFSVQFAVGQGPVGTVSPTSLNIIALVGQTSPQQKVSLFNTGTSQLTISSISISGDFALPVNHCAAGVKPGTHCDVYVTFAPKAVETETGTLTFTDNAANSPQTVSITGTGANTVNTITKLTASPKYISPGQSITFTVTVTSLGGGIIPNGELVTFSPNDCGLGTGTLTGGVVVLSSATCQGDEYQQEIVAQYQGDQSFYSSQGDATIIVTRYDTTLTMTGNPNPSIYGQPFSTSVTVNNNGGPPPTGNVNCHYADQPPRPCGFTVTQLEDAPGTNVGAYFYGDQRDKPSFGSMLQVINPTTTTTTIKSSKNPSKQGQPVTLLAVVTTPWPNVHVVYGSVTFMLGSTTLGTVTLSDSRGSITTSTLPVGQNTITAIYTPGNANFLGGSGSFVQTVQ